MKEQTIQKKIIKYLEDQGAYVVKTISTNKKGTPDLLVCYNGYFIGLEVKVPGKEYNVTKLQEVSIAKIKQAGGKAAVVSSVEQVEKLLKELV